MDNRSKIEKLRQSGNRFFLTMTGLEKPLSVSEQLVYKFKLKEGIVLTEPQLEHLKRESALFECDRETSRILSLREHSTGELRFKLKRKKFDLEIIKQMIKKYADLGFLDDDHYAFKLAENSLERNPSGRAYLVAFLQRKMLKREEAERAADMVLAGREEKTLAVASLKKRWHLFRELELERARKKAYNYLSRRGIGYQAAKAAFEMLYNQENEADEY